jgi:hypothetical protein
MQITLVIRLGDMTERTWRREVDRPYPGVPQPGDWIYLADTDEGQGMFAMPVSLVTWDNDGSVTLTFEVHDSSYAAQMEAFGFTARQSSHDS